VRWSRRPRKRVPAERGRRSRDGGLQEKRQLIEGVIDQLKNIFALERHRAKTLGGLLTRLVAKRSFENPPNKSLFKANRLPRHAEPRLRYDDLSGEVPVQRHRR
jgi:hypothetical protein